MSRRWNSFLAVSLAVLGGVLGLASLFGEWSRVVLLDGTTALAWALYSPRGRFPGTIGLLYVAALIALTVIAAVVVFGRDRGRGSGLRMAGLVVCVLSLVLLGFVVSMVMFIGGSIPYREPGSSFDQNEILGWGVYVAFGALTALGAALLVPSPARRRPAAVTDAPEVV